MRVHLKLYIGKFKFALQGAFFFDCIQQTEGVFGHAVNPCGQAADFIPGTGVSFNGIIPICYFFHGGGQAA